MPPRRRVESARNPLVREVAALRERQARDRTGLTLVEGGREVGRALEADVTVRTLLLCPELHPSPAAWHGLAEQAETRGIEVVLLSQRAFERVTMRQRPDGVAAVAAWKAASLDRLALAPDPFLLVLDGVEKPGNVGALLRTADAAGVDAVVLTDPGTDAGNPNVIRASMGSVFALPVAVVDAAEARRWLRSLPARIVAAAPGAGASHWSADYRGCAAIVLGAEDSGLSTAWLETADQCVRIPMRGRVADSLNVAVAGAVLMYEALRQRAC